MRLPWAEKNGNPTNKSWNNATKKGITLTVSKTDIELFGHWNSLHDLEQHFWSVSNSNSAFVMRQGGSKIKKIRDEILPIIALSKELAAGCHAWDQKLEIKCNVTDKKTCENEEYDARIRWESFQPELTSDLPPQFIEVTRCQIDVRAERKEDKKLAEGKIPELILRKTEGWRELYEKAQERIESKIAKNYPRETILVLYFDGAEANNAVNWIKQNEACLDTLKVLARQKFSHLFMWGPSAGRCFIDLSPVPAKL